MDKYIIGENSSGKTRKMLEEAKNSGSVVVCNNPLRMQDKAHSYGIYGLEFVSYDELNADTVCGVNVAIDEIGDFFEHCFGVKLNSFTMTVE